VLAQKRHRNGLCFLQDPSRAPEFKVSEKENKRKEFGDFHEQGEEKRAVPVL